MCVITKWISYSYLQWKHKIRSWSPSENKAEIRQVFPTNVYVIPKHSHSSIFSFFFLKMLGRFFFKLFDFFFSGREFFSTDPAWDVWLTVLNSGITWSDICDLIQCDKFENCSDFLTLKVLSKLMSNSDKFCPNYCQILISSVQILISSVQIMSKLWYGMICICLSVSKGNKKSAFEMIFYVCKVVTRLKFCNVCIPVKKARSTTSRKYKQYLQSISFLGKLKVAQCFNSR